MPLRRTLLFLVFALAGCAGSTPAGVDRTPTFAVVRQPAGTLEQHLTVELDPPAMLDARSHTILIRSTITNRGTAPVRLRSRVCRLLDADIESTARLDRIDALVLCGATEMSTDLAPGESTPQIEQGFAVRSGPGDYTIGIRQALEPDFRATVSFRIP